jgi:hypothetical protein
MTRPKVKVKVSRCLNEDGERNIVVKTVLDTIDEFLNVLLNNAFYRDLLAVATGKTNVNEIREVLKRSWEETLCLKSKEEAEKITNYCLGTMIPLLLTIEIDESREDIALELLAEGKPVVFN